MAEFVFKGDTVVAPKDPASALLAGKDFQFVEELVPDRFPSVEKVVEPFVPWLAKIGKHKRGEEAREFLLRVSANDSLRLGTAAELIAFGITYPQYPGPAHPDPILAIGEKVTVGDYDRIADMFWGPGYGRSLYTHFDEASFGPLVSYLLIGKP